MLLLLSLLAHADSGPTDNQGDFALPERTDAPTDALLLYDANFDVSANVVEGPGAPFALASESLLPYPSGNETLVQFTHAWEAGATYRIEVPAQGWDEAAFGEISFTVGTSAAPAPSTPTVLGVTVGDWSEEEEQHVWGCCGFTREVSFEVESTSADPWAYVELKGLFEGETQITETPSLQRLDVGIGPGTHTLRYRQWEQDGALNPPAFEIAAVSSSGVRGEAQRIDIADDTEAPGPPLCGTSGAAGFAPLALALLLVRRRTR